MHRCAIKPYEANGKILIVRKTIYSGVVQQHYLSIPKLQRMQVILSITRYTGEVPRKLVRVISNAR